MTHKHGIARRGPHRQAARGYQLTEDFGPSSTPATEKATETATPTTLTTLTASVVVEPSSSSALSSSTASSSSFITSVTSSSSSSALPSSSSITSSSSSSSSLRSSSSSFSSSTSRSTSSSTSSSTVQTTATPTTAANKTSTVVVTPTLRKSSSTSASASSSASAGLSNAASSKSSSLGGGSIAGIIVALVAFFGAIILLIVVRKRKNRERRRATEAYASYIPDHDRSSGYGFGNEDIMGGGSSDMAQRGGARPMTFHEPGQAGMGAGGAGVMQTSTPSPPMPSYSMTPQPSSPISMHSANDYFPDVNSLGRASAANSSYAAVSSPSVANFPSSPLQHQANFASAMPGPGQQHPFANAYSAPATQVYQAQPVQMEAAHQGQMFYPDQTTQMMVAGGSSAHPELRQMTHSPPPQLQQHLQYSPQHHAEMAQQQKQQEFHAISTSQEALAVPAPVYTPQPVESQYQPMGAANPPHFGGDGKQGGSTLVVDSQQQGRRSVYDTDDAYGGM